MAEVTKKLPLSAVLRLALVALGVDASREEVVAWCNANHADVMGTAQAGTLGTSLSIARKAMRGGKSEKKSSSNGRPALEGLLAVDAYVKSQPGLTLKKVIDQVAQVNEVASKVGGIAGLIECLETIRKLK